MKKSYHQFLIILFIAVAGITTSSCKESTAGPEQKPEEPKVQSLEVSSIQPDSGAYGTPVIIEGMGFSATLSTNKVLFNGTEANVDSATSTELYTTVPEGATSGNVEVELDRKTAAGPKFEVLTKGAFQLIITTEGFDLDRDGYIAKLNGQFEMQSSVNDTLMFEEIEQGDYQFALEDLDNVCSVQTSDSQTVRIVAQDTAHASLEIECENVILKNKIVYRKCGDQCDGLYVMNSDGTDERQLTSHSFDTNPVISPDGTKVAFVNANRNPDVEGYKNEIYIVDASGYPITNIPRIPESQNDDIPSWSPDGKKLVFMEGNSNSLDIVSVNIDGTGRRRITNDYYADFWPVYTPDGSKIIFHSLNRPDPGNSEIFIMNSDGTDITQLSDIDSFTNNLAVSHDGSMIAFSLPEDKQIYVMNIDGTNMKMLTHGIDSYGFPSWSPDGNQLIFYNNTKADIFRVNIDGSGLTNLTNTPEIDEPNPHWSPVE